MAALLPATGVCLGSRRLCSHAAPTRAVLPVLARCVTCKATTQQVLVTVDTNDNASQVHRHGGAVPPST